MKVVGRTRIGIHLAAHHQIRRLMIMLAPLLLAVVTWSIYTFNAQPENGTRLTTSSVKYSGFSYLDSSFHAVASDNDLHIISGTLRLSPNTRYLVKFKLRGVPTRPTYLHVDLYAPGYDNPEQEVNFRLGYEALPKVLTGGFSTGPSVPAAANIRFFYSGKPGLKIGEIQIARVPVWRIGLQNVCLAIFLSALLLLLVVFSRWVFDEPEQRCEAGVRSVGHAAASMGSVYAIIVLVRFVSAWLQPYWSGDEYLYKAIASGIWAYGHAGHLSPNQLLQSLNLPNLLYPYLIAPAFIFGSDFYTAIRLFNALVVSAALFPVYAITRRMAGYRVSLTLAVISCLLPSVNIAAYAVTEVLYFPLFLVCAWLAVRSLENPLSVLRNLLLGIAVGVLLNVKLNGMVVIPAYLLALLVTATFDRKLSLLVRRPSWIAALVSTIISYIVLRAVLVGDEVAGLGFYRSHSGGWISSALSAAVADPSGLLRLLTGHLTILTIIFSVCIATVALALFDKPVSASEKNRRGVVVLLVLLFAASAALAVLFTLGVSSVDLGGLGRWHSRYYFMALPLLLVCGLAVPRSRPSSRSQIVYWAIMCLYGA
ncbi:MAG: glycosyltransferase family 39 protein, partial [Halothiobacillus sp.]|nr:glycosyltransferase family 39 protein [Halothiobacillus sp.]